MNWIVKYLTSSIGRKQIMGATGLLVAVWILGHMVGNLVLLGPILDPSSLDHTRLGYNTYSWLLTHNKAFIYGMELVMTLALLTHFFMAVTLKLENAKARPIGYGVDAKKGKRSIASFTMIYSGIWIFGYLVFHLLNIKFGSHYDYTTLVSSSPDVWVLPPSAHSTTLSLEGFPIAYNGEHVRDMFLTTVEEFGKPLFAGVYVVSMGVLSLHLVHAISSVFQTMGINHQRWNPIIKFASIGYAAVVSLGFAAEAIACYLIKGMI